MNLRNIKTKQDIIDYELSVSAATISGFTADEFNAYAVVAAAYCYDTNGWRTSDRTSADEITDDQLANVLSVVNKLPEAIAI